MVSDRRILVSLAYVISMTFVVGGFAAVVSLPLNDLSEDASNSPESINISPAARPPPTAPSLLAHWDMSTLSVGGKVRNLADASGATDGTKYNTVPSANGRVGGSLDFNGVSAAVDCPDPNNLTKSDSGTVSAWIKSTGKPTVTKELRAAIVILENGENATVLDEYKRMFRLVGNESERIYGEIFHGHGSLNVSDTIYVQTPINVTLINHQLVELNNFIANKSPDIYDYICFFTKKSWTEGEMTFKNTIHGIGQPWMWYDDRVNNTIGNYTEPSSSYITAAALLSNNHWPVNESRVDFSAKILIHELSHAYCAWWSYKVDGTNYSCPKYDRWHYSANLRTDNHSALGGMGWTENLDGTWTATSYLIPYWPVPTFPPPGPFDFVDFNMDEYAIGLIPASDIVPSHVLVPDKGSFGTPGLPIMLNDSMSLTPAYITKEQVLAAMGPRWNEEDRQCVMLRCTNEHGKALGGQGWGLFVGTVAPYDHVFWYSGSADGAIEWRYGNAHVGDGAWHNIAVTFTGTTGKLYVDGVLDIQWQIHAVAAASNVHTVIGCEDPSNPYFESWFNGSIDEVRIYNKVLTDAEIKELYNSAPPVTTAMLSGTLGNGGWYISAVTVTLNAADSNGIMATYYKVDSASQYTTYQNPFLAPNGKHTVTFYSKDKLGYQETPAKTINVWVDPTTPSTSLILDAKKLTVAFSVVDVSGAELTTFYKLDINNWAQYMGPFKTTKGPHTIQFFSVDRAGWRETTRNQNFTF